MGDGEARTSRPAILELRHNIKFHLLIYPKS